MEAVDIMIIRKLAVLGVLFAVVWSCSLASAGVGNAAICSFREQMPYAAGKGSDGVEIGDINGDGSNELVVANRMSINLTLFRQTSGDKDWLEEYQTIPVSWPPAVLAIGDINQDGLSDVVIAHYDNYLILPSRNFTNTFGVCYQNATTHLLDPETSYTFSYGTSSRAIATGDVNNDGWPEVVVANEGTGNQIYIWTWNQMTSKLEQTDNYASTSSNVISITVGDVTGDNLNDVVLYGSSLVVFAQDNVGKLVAAVNYGDTGSKGQPGGESGDIGDVNGDGLNDVVGSTAFSGEITVWLQNATTHQIEKHGTLNCGSYTEDTEVADLNDDGLADVAVASRDYSKLYLFYQNATTHELEPPVNYSAFPDKWLNELAVGDLNGDGVTDIAGSNWGEGSVGNPNPPYTWASVWLQNNPSSVPDTANAAALVALGAGISIAAMAARRKPEN